MELKKITVIGLGYIGLPTAALLASRGYRVAGVDINPKVVETINQGDIHIVEPDLDVYVRSAVQSEKLKAYLQPQQADIYIICVPTPFFIVNDIPQPNIEYILKATDSIKKLVKNGDIIILESTSPVGTTETIKEVLINFGVDVEQLHIAYCPERVLPGKIMVELIENDRIVGGLTRGSSKIVGDFYRTFVKGEVFETDAPTAEMCKLVENSYRDVNIAFANEISILSANAGVNIWELIHLANRHPRVNILQPGVGVGGHCIAVDPWFLIARDQKNSILLKAARNVNNFKTKWTIEQIKTSINEIEIKKKNRPKIVCLGAAFKPNIDDLRESPALQVSKALHSEGYDVSVVEPYVESLESLNLMKIERALSEADIIVILVKHKEFIELSKIGAFENRVVLDFCGVDS